MEKRYIYDSTMLGYLEQNIGSIADREFAQIGEDSTVTEATKLMRNNDTTSIFVTKKNSFEPIGIVTERDILYRVLAQDRSLCHFIERHHELSAYLY
jgi:predicted transcriptional regulator